jgi:epoxyqueuosine reductase
MHAGPPASAEPAVSPELVKAQAYGLGFDLVGIARLGPVESAPIFERWLAAGHAGTMHYLERGAAARRDTRLPAPGTSSAVVVAMNYGGTEPTGPVARYARGDDYHEVMVERLRSLHRWIDERCGRAVAGKAYVDTGPILERDLARLAGLGWFGKNTMLINPRLGSFFFLGTLLLDLALEPDPPFDSEHCGTCRRCIDACPTGAIVGERELDARRCISYLTIELRDEIPRELQPLLGELLFGCDICQDVCPWNVKFARRLAEGSPYAPRSALGSGDAESLARALLAMTQDEFAARFRHSPLKRAKLAGLKRNAAVVLANLARRG